MRKILVIEDDIDICELLIILLKETGYTVFTHSTGHGALNVVKELCPDLLLMDIRLDGVDGREICRKLKDNPATETVPVILLSASEDLRGTLNFTGAPNDFIAKPFDIDFLLSTIQKHLPIQGND